MTKIENKVDFMFKKSVLSEVETWMCHCSLQTEGGMILFTTQGNQWWTEALPKSSLVHSSLRLKGTMTFLYEKHGFNLGMKNSGEWKNLAGWTLTWIFDSFSTKSEKSSNHFFKKLRILNKDQRFKSKERKNLSEWKNPAR